jgi:hypothetical protein
MRGLDKNLFELALLEFTAKSTAPFHDNVRRPPGFSFSVV